MLVLFENMVGRVRWLKVPVFIALLLMCGVSAWVILAAPVGIQDRWLIPVILLTLWFLLGASCLSLFAEVPAADDTQPGWVARLRKKLVRLIYHLMAWFMLVVSLSLLVISFQLMMAWMRSI